MLAKVILIAPFACVLTCIFTGVFSWVVNWALASWAVCLSVVATFGALGLALAAFFGEISQVV